MLNININIFSALHTEDWWCPALIKERPLWTRGRLYLCPWTVEHKGLLVPRLISVTPLFVPGTPLHLTVYRTHKRCPAPICTGNAPAFDHVPSTQRIIGAPPFFDNASLGDLVPCIAHTGLMVRCHRKLTPCLSPRRMPERCSGNRDEPGITLAKYPAHPNTWSVHVRSMFRDTI